MPRSSHDPALVTDENRAFVIEWLRDRSAFHSWFSSLVTGSFVVITVFGAKPALSTFAGAVLLAAFVLLLFGLV